jgi:integrase
MGEHVPKLTAKSVEKAKPGRHADGSGLYLFVKPSGARSWVLRVQVNGERRDIGLGGVDTSTLSPLSEIGDDLPLEQRDRLTLAQARELASRLRNVAKAGRDPTAERRRDRRAPPSFREATEATHKALSESWGDKTGVAFLSSLKQHAYPHLGEKRVDEIDADDIATALLPIWAAKPSMARKVRQRIAKVLDFAKAKRWRESEAPRQAIGTLVGKQQAGGNFPAMPYREVPDFFRSLTEGTETVGRLALMLTIATAARSGEVRQSTWGLIDWEARDWNRPREMMKKSKQPHTVTLNALALDVLRRAAALTDSSKPGALIFSNSRGKALSDMTLSKIMRDAGLPYVPHGFRSSFRDWAAEQMPHIPDPVAEAALAHVVPDAVVKAYKRTQFIAMRRQLLEAWGQFLAGVESNVLRFDKVRA